MNTRNIPTMKRTTPGAASLIFDSKPISLAVHEVEPATPFSPRIMPPIIVASPRTRPSVAYRYSASTAFPNKFAEWEYDCGRRSLVEDLAFFLSCSSRAFRSRTERFLLLETRPRRSASSFSSSIVKSCDSSIISLSSRSTGRMGELLLPPDEKLTFLPYVASLAMTVVPGSAIRILSSSSQEKVLLTVSGCQ